MPDEVKKEINMYKLKWDFHGKYIPKVFDWNDPCNSKRRTTFLYVYSCGKCVFNVDVVFRDLPFMGTYSSSVKIKRNKFRRIGDFKVCDGDFKTWPSEEKFLKRMNVVIKREKLQETFGETLDNFQLVMCFI
jgi:hypothetical protein